MHSDRRERLDVGGIWSYYRDAETYGVGAFSFLSGRQFHNLSLVGKAPFFRGLASRRMSQQQRLT